MLYMLSKVITFPTEQILKLFKGIATYPIVVKCTPAIYKQPQKFKINTTQLAV